VSDAKPVKPETDKSPAVPERRMPDFSRLPANFFRIIDAPGWVNAILYGEKYKEPDPDFISRTLAAQAIFAETIEDAFSAAGIESLQKWVLDKPGETTGPIEITDLYVAASDFETGNPSYVIVTCVSLETGVEVKFSTGATNVQATMIGLLRNGVWPLRVQIKRGETKDKGGRYLLFMLPPD
jgi:hypothetical protein